MSGQKVIPLHPSRRMRSAVVEDGTIGMLAFVIVEAMMFAGLMSAFAITRATAGGAWPPAGQPRLPLEETAINTAALLASGVVVYLASRAWQEREARTGPLLLGAIATAVIIVPGIVRSLAPTVGAVDVHAQEAVGLLPHGLINKKSKS